MLVFRVHQVAGCLVAVARVTFAAKAEKRTSETLFLSSRTRGECHQANPLFSNSCFFFFLEVKSHSCSDSARLRHNAHGQ
jgi:hypothetical protein